MHGATLSQELHKSINSLNFMILLNLCKLANSMKFIAIPLYKCNDLGSFWGRSCKYIHTALLFPISQISCKLVYFRAAALSVPFPLIKITIWRAFGGAGFVKNQKFTNSHDFAKLPLESRFEAECLVFYENCSPKAS